MKNKAFLFLKDLVFYDGRLNLTYNNLDAFSNTNAKVTNSIATKMNNNPNNNDVCYD